MCDGFQMINVQHYYNSEHFEDKDGARWVINGITSLGGSLSTEVGMHMF